MVTRRAVRSVPKKTSTSKSLVSSVADEMLKGNKSIPNPSKGSTDKGYVPPTSLDESTRQFRAARKADQAKGKTVKPKLISSKKSGGGGGPVGGSKGGLTKRAHGVG